jgi:peptide/nickel transport system ATP-binding protein
VSLLKIEDLSVHYQTGRGEVHALDNVSLHVQEGAALGLVGESGCGKTTVAMTIMRLLAPNARILTGRLIFQGADLLTKSEEEMRRVRWRMISMIFQAAMNALNPVQRVGDQIVEAILAHDGEMTPESAQDRVADLYGMVGLDAARMQDYPHQYSGGMKQRAVIAMALACKPALIIADEPTTALDVVVQDQILAEIRRLQLEMNLALLYISHDISTIIRACDQMGVMYAGQLLEYGSTEEVTEEPIHPYTKGLMQSYPKLSGPKERLQPIPGEPPNLLDPPHGCRFCPRCPVNGEQCRVESPVMREYRPGHFAKCHRIDAEAFHD